MFKKEIKPLSEAMVEKIAKTINKIEYVEEKVEVESLDESKALLKDYQEMKAQGKKDSSIMDVLMSMPKYKKMSRDQMAKVIGDAKRKGIFKEEVELDESKERVILKKGNYTFVNNDEDEQVHVKLKGKNIARGQFDSLAGGWFFSVKGQRGQKFFREPEDVINFFMKEEVELDENQRSLDAHKFKQAAKVKAGIPLRRPGESLAAYVTRKAKAQAKMQKEAMDPVDSKALKGKHSERKDKDIDNDGDVDSSDEYLHKRRQAISKAIGKIKEAMSPLQKIRMDKEKADRNKDDNAKTRTKRISDKQYAGYKVKMKEEVEQIDEAKWEYKADATYMVGGNLRYDDKLEYKLSKANADILNKYMKQAKSDAERSKVWSMFWDSKETGNHAKGPEMAIAYAKKVIKEEVELDEAFASNMNKAAKKAQADAAEKIKKMGPVTRDTLADINAKLGNTTKKEEVELDEGYTINHKTFSSAVQHAKAQVEKQGYTIDDDEWDRKVAMGPKKPGTGKTNRYTIDLMKGGKETRRKLQMQVYYDEGRYELNMYVS